MIIKVRSFYLVMTYFQGFLFRICKVFKGKIFSGYGDIAERTDTLTYFNKEEEILIR